MKSTIQEFNQNLNKNDLDFCRKYINRYGSNYRLAAALFSKHVKNDTTILYAFFRFIDEIVDNPLPGMSLNDVINELDAIKNEWQKLIDLEGETNGINPILRATYGVFVRNNIPFEYSIAFIDSMITDTNVSRYKTYKELESYMYGSATVVGYIMTHIVGYSDEKTMTHARSYGEAMQLTNFLRDIEDDYVTRDRIYLPQDMMHHYGVTEEMIAQKNNTQELINLIKDLSDKCRVLYIDGRKGFKYLNKKNLLPIIIAGDIYEYNLELLKSRNYNPFGKPIRVRTFTKIKIIIKAYISSWLKIK